MGGLSHPTFPTSGLCEVWMSLVTKKEMRELAFELYQAAPGTTCSWEMLHKDVQDKWVDFARYAYMTVTKMKEKS